MDTSVHVSGPIMYSRLLNKDIIIINSEKIAKDLMVRRSANFSDRPVLVTNVLYAKPSTSIHV
ncbi:hypothetical protein SERLADRAFT_390492, partial [Serpula lacrymans var. lacrymans S7.9]